MFHKKWFECAGSSKIVDGELVQDTPPTTEQLQVWIDNDLTNDSEIRSDVRHRYVLTRGNYSTMLTWMKAQFWFRNATRQQLTQVYDIMISVDPNT